MAELKISIEAGQAFIGSSNIITDPLKMYTKFVIPKLNFGWTYTEMGQKMAHDRPLF